MTKLKFFILIIVSHTIFSGCEATPQQQDQHAKRKRPSPERLIKDLDKNKDGKLSKSELKGPIKRDFVRIDKNKDGYITLAELKAMPKPKHGKKQAPPPREK